MKPQNTINRAPHTPRYLALYQRLRDEILSGALKRADKLPSKREMTLNEGVSVITVEHAYALLEEEGYVEAREKSGFYVTFDLSGKEGQKKEALPRISGSITEAPDDFPFSVYQGVIRRVLSTYDRRILVKSPNSGLPELREAIAAYLYRSRALNIDPEDIVIGAGAEYLYGLLVELLGPLLREDPESLCGPGRPRRPAEDRAGRHLREAPVRDRKRRPSRHAL